MKKQMRSEILSKRNGLNKETITEKSHMIKLRLFDIPEFINADTLLFYIDFRREVETKNMIQQCMDIGKRIIIPVIVPGSKDLFLSELKSLDELSPGSYGILEPKKEFLRHVDINDIDVVIVPGVAFDQEGFRLGYGGGYYDRLIEKLPCKCFTIGIAFEIQIVNQVPREDHDMKINMIITESRIIHTKKCGEDT